MQKPCPGPKLSIMSASFTAQELREAAETWLRKSGILVLSLIHMFIGLCLSVKKNIWSTERCKLNLCSGLQTNACCEVPDLVTHDAHGVEYCAPRVNSPGQPQRGNEAGAAYTVKAPVLPIPLGGSVRSWMASGNRLSEESSSRDSMTAGLAVDSHHNRGCSKLHKYERSAGRRREREIFQ